MSNLNKQLAALAILIITLFSGAILTATCVEAQAEPLETVKSVILWDKPNRQGAFFESNEKVKDLSAVGFDNRTSSIAVNNGKKWRFYKNKNFKGAYIEMEPDEFRPNLGGLNHQISSFKPAK